MNALLFINLIYKNNLNINENCIFINCSFIDININLNENNYIYLINCSIDKMKIEGVKNNVYIFNENNKNKDVCLEWKIASAITSIFDILFISIFIYIFIKIKNGVEEEYSESS